MFINNILIFSKEKENEVYFLKKKNKEIIIQCRVYKIKKLVLYLLFLNLKNNYYKKKSFFFYIKTKINIHN